MKIGILGGTFDPPHRGHLIIAQQLKEQLNLDEVWLMPVSAHSFDKKLSQVAHRFEMVKRMEEPGIRASNFEIELGGVSRTIYTMRSLKRSFTNDSFIFCMGSDLLQDFHKWDHWEVLLSENDVVVFPRGGIDGFKEYVEKSFGKNRMERVTVLDHKDLIVTNISSTQVRDRLKKTLPIHHLVASEVASYIEDNLLYTLPSPLPSHTQKFNPKEFLLKSDTFIGDILKKTGKKNIVLSVSGGIDSATSFNVISRVLPKEHIHVIHLPYFDHSIKLFHETISPLNLPKENIHLSPIRQAVDMIAENDKTSFNDKLRLGNIMARVRMIMVYDLAKKIDGLVCGTENRTERYLGYFTRFGDAASDIELITSLFKTEVRALARYLKIPKSVRDTPPSAGLWEGQTDEKELGFSYSEIDSVLQMYFDKGRTLTDIEKGGHVNARKIIDLVKTNQFKQEVPYCLEEYS